MNQFKMEPIWARTASGLLLIALLALGLAPLGCGTNQYERVMIARAKDLKQASAFRKLMPPQQVPGTALWIRLPEQFYDKPLQEGRTLAGGVVDQQRLKPLMLELPGLTATYEAMIPETDAEGDSARKVAWYCYVLQVRYRKGLYYDPGENIRRQFLENEIETDSQWVDVECPTPEGRRIDWKILHATAVQPFYTVQGEGPGKIEQMPGSFDVYLRREGDYVLGLVWRVPDAVRSRIEWPKFAQLTGGCLQLKSGTGGPPAGGPGEQVAGGPGEEPGEPGEEPSGGTVPETPGPGETASTPTPEGPEQPGTTPGQTSGEPGPGTEPGTPGQQPTDSAQLTEESMANLRKIGEAFQEYYRSSGQFPASAPFVDRTRKPLLSWRVAVLPGLGEAELYGQFRLNEPWDSPHNLELAKRMPEAFKTPGGPEGPKTCYLAAVGPGTALSAVQGLRRETLSDGPANTLIVVEADPDRAVVWTQPEDWQYVPAQPNDGLGALRGDCFLGLAADGSVHRVPLSAPADVLRAAFSAQGGEPFEMGNFAGLPATTGPGTTGPSEQPGEAQPGEPTSPATDLLAQAREALQQGREQEGLLLLMADAVVRVNPEVLATLRWFPAGKQPRLALRWALALEMPEMPSGPGTSGAQPMSAEQMAQYWDDKILQPLSEQLQARVTQGRFGQWLAESKNPGGATQAEVERRPGMVILKAPDLEQIRRLAQQEGVDVALIGRIRPRRVPNAPMQSVIQFVLLDIGGDQRLWSSSELNNRRVEAAEQGQIQATPVEDFLAEITQRIDRECVLLDMPPISREAALGRAETLVELAAQRPLPALMELRYYQWKELLKPEEVSGLYQRVLGVQDGARLADGTSEERLEVVQRWLAKPEAP